MEDQNQGNSNEIYRQPQLKTQTRSAIVIESKSQTIYDNNKQRLKSRRRGKNSYQESLKTNFEVVCQPIDKFRNGEALNENYMKIIANYINVTPPYLYIEEMDYIEMARHYHDNYPLLGLRKILILMQMIISQLCLWIVKSSTFETVSLTVILANSILLIFQEPNASDSDSNSLLTQLDFVFLILYTIEMGLKVFAYGFIMGPKAYIRDTWNILDFIIVSTAYLPYVLGSTTVNLKSLRFTRILRPLRTITSIRALKVIMRALFSALPMLCDSFVIVLFVFLIFGIGGLQLWQGLFKLQCFHNEYGYPLLQPMSCGYYDCPKDYICGKMLENPNKGTTNFDNILYSFLQVFIVTTLEGWTDIMSYVDATFSPFARIYFICLIFIGAYFLLNIILAVIKAKFTDTQTEEQDEEYKIGHTDPSDTIAKQLQIWDTANQYQVKKIINQEFYFSFNQIKQFPKFYIPFQKLRNERRNIKQNLEQSEIPSPLLNNSIEDPHSSLNQFNNSVSLLNPKDKAPYKFSSQQNLELPHPDVQFASLNQNSRRLTGKQLASLQFDQILNTDKILTNNYKAMNQFSFQPNEIPIDILNKAKCSLKQLNQQNQPNQWSEDRYAELVQDFKQRSQETSQMDITISIKNHKTSEIGVEHNCQDLVVNQEYLEIQNSLIETLQPHYAKIFVHIHEIPIQILSTSYSDVLNRSIKYRNDQKKISLQIAIKLKKYKYNIPTYQLNPILDEMHNQKKNIKARNDYNNKGSTVADSMYEESRLPMRRNHKKRVKSNESTGSIIISANQEQLILDVKYSSQKKDFNYTYSDYQLQMAFGIETPIVSDVPEYAIIYEQIKETEFYEGIRSAILWSGFDILNQSFYQIQRTNKIINRIQEQNKVIWLTGIKGIWIMGQYLCLTITKSKEFENAITMTVFLNTSMMCIQSFYDDQNPIFLMLNDIFTSVFATEMALKLLATGVGEYLRDSLNILDGFIVILSFVEIFIFSGGGSAAGAFKAFRTFRVLRVTKLFKSLEFMKIIISVVVRSFSSFIYISILLFLFTFIYALIGRTLYQGKCDLYGEEPLRSNFDSLYFTIFLSIISSQGLITVFQLLTLENWNQILYVLIRCDVQPVITCIFLVSWIFIGNYILLNLFLAILLDGFTNAQIQEDDEEEAQCETVLDPRGYITSDEWDHFFYKLQKKTGNKEFNLKIIAQVKNRKKLEKEEEPKEQEFEGHRNNQNDESVEIKLKNAEKLKKKNQLILNYANLKCDESLWIFPKTSQFRHMCYKIVSWSQFESIILLLIGLSSLKLIYDTYLPTNATTPEDQLQLDISKALDYFFNISFAIEMVLKIITYGLFFEEDTYFQDFWNILDGFIVFSSIIDMSLDGVDLAAVKILRLLRTLRPLRFVSHNINMKIVVNALLQSVGSIFNVLIVVFLLWLMFAILGTALFKERLYYCDVDVYFNINISQCNSQWVIQRNNFENVANASLSLFVVATLEGWPDYMYQAIDSDLAQYGPHKNETQAFAFFYVIFILIGSFFLLNLFVGALCYNFDKAQKNEKSGGISFMTPEQQKWIELNVMLRHAEPEVIGKWVPQKGIRNSLYNLIQSNQFEVFIMSVILMNIVLMALDYEGSPPMYQTVLETINLVFTFTFILEAILKIMALTIRGYLDSGWNQFDCFIVCSSIIDLVVGFVGGNSLSILSFGPQLIRIIRVFRITRILRLVKQLKGMQKLIETIMISLPSLLNVGALLLLVMFIYSILGWFLFNGVKEGWKIGEYYNFNNFGSSIVTLFRCLTGEDWPMIMYDLMRTDPSCIQGKTCGSIYSIPFFISYILICTFIMLNLFILIVLQNFEEYNLKKNNPLENFKENLEVFQIVWAKYSIEHQGVRINKKYLRTILTELEPPLGVGNVAEKQIATKLIQMDLREDRMNCLYFNDVFYELMKIAYGNNFNDEINQNLINKMLESEQKTKSALFAKKKQTYSKILEEKEFHTFKINPFFRDIFMKTVFLSWMHYSERQKIFINRRAKNGQTIHHINQLKRQFLIPSDDSSGSEYDPLKKRSDSSSESELSSYRQKPQVDFNYQSRRKISTIQLNNFDQIRESPIENIDRNFSSFQQQDQFDKENQLQNPIGISISDYSQILNQGSQSVQNNQVQKRILTKSRPNSVSSHSYSRRVSFEDEIGQMRNTHGNQIQRDDKPLNEVIFEDVISQQSNQGERQIEQFFKSLEFGEKLKNPTINTQMSMEIIEMQIKSSQFEQKSENKQCQNQQSQQQVLQSSSQLKSDFPLDLSNIHNISPKKQIEIIDTKIQMEIDSMLSSSPMTCLQNEVSSKFSYKDDSIIKRDFSQDTVNSEQKPNMQIRFGSVKPPENRIEKIQIKPQIRKNIQESSSSFASGGLSVVVQGKQFENIVLPQEKNESFDQVKNNLLQKMNFQQQGKRAQQNLNQNQKINFYETAYVRPSSKSPQYGTQYGASNHNAFNFANPVNQAYDFVKLDQQLSPPNKVQEGNLSPIKGQEGRLSPNKRQDASKIQDLEVDESYGKEIKTRQRQKMNQIILAYNDERRVRFRTPENRQKQ